MSSSHLTSSLVIKGWYAAPPAFCQCFGHGDPDRFPGQSGTLGPRQRFKQYPRQGRFVPEAPQGSVQRRATLVGSSDCQPGLVTSAGSGRSRAEREQPPYEERLRPPVAGGGALRYRRRYCRSHQAQHPSARSRLITGGDLGFQQRRATEECSQQGLADHGGTAVQIDGRFEHQRPDPVLVGALPLPPARQGGATAGPTSHPTSSPGRWPC